MTRNERHEFEIKQCQAFPQMDSYGDYWNIPKKDVCEGSLVAWLLSGGKFDQIPAELRTQDVLWAGVRHDREAFSLIARNEANDHKALTLEAVRLGHADFDQVPEEYIDEDFLIGATEHGFGRPFAKSLWQAQPDLFTERVAKIVCSRTISQARDFCLTGGEEALKLWKDEYLINAIKNQISDAGSLEGMGKAYVLSGMIADGFWPSYPEYYKDELRHPPATPTDALERLSSKLSPGDQMLHRCWLQNQPTSEVVAALQGSRHGLDELFLMYPEQELRKHMRSNRALSGRILENDLGM